MTTMAALVARVMRELEVAVVVGVEVAAVAGVMAVVVVVVEEVGVAVAEVGEDGKISSSESSLTRGLFSKRFPIMSLAQPC
jgi:hypothetical protein